MKLNLKSKRLRSGRFEIHFSTEGLHGFYGYLLAEPKTPVTTVVDIIATHIRWRLNPYYLPPHFSYDRQIHSDRILIFKK